MKYFVGYLIRGEAANWHNKVSKEVSDKFNTWKIYENIPPHITLFRPFVSDDIKPIKGLLNNWAATHKITADLIMSGFDHFGDRVVFAKIQTPPAITKAVTGLKKELLTIPKMPGEDFPGWHPHATIAYLLAPDIIMSIWNYVSVMEKPHFILPFNNVTLFCNSGERTWKVGEIFPVSAL